MKHSTKNDQLPSLKYLASFDLGNASAKIATATLKTDFRSIAGRLSRARRFGDLKSPLVFSFEGETLVFGDEARDLIDGEPVAYTDMTRYTSGFYRKLFAAALWRAFQDIAPEGVVYPTVVCSIPVIEYAAGRADEVRKNICGSYVIEGYNGKTLYAHVKASEIVIVPEGAGSYFQAISAGNGLGAQEVAILDIGFYTTDLTIFNQGNYVAGSARSAKHGVRQVADAVHYNLVARHDYEGDLWAVDNVLEVGEINIANQCVQFREVRDQAFQNLVADLLTFYRSSKGSRSPAAVLLSGGGATGAYSFLPDDLRAQGWGIVPGDPRRANVDGAFLFLQQRESKRQI
jgi:plasmid segregation protein ParM